MIKTVNPLRSDPTRTSLLRRKFGAEFSRRFNRLKQSITKLIVDEDALGLKEIKQWTLNAREFSSTQVNITDKEVIYSLKTLQSLLDPKDVIKLEDEPHITVRFGLHDLEPDRASWIVSQHGKIEARLANTLSLFRSEENDVLKIDVESEDLESLNAHLGILPNTQTHHGYHPHLTVAYLEPGTGDKYVGINWTEEIALTFDTVVFSSKDKTKTPLVLNADCGAGIPGSPGFQRGNVCASGRSAENIAIGKREREEDQQIAKRREKEDEAIQEQRGEEWNKIEHTRSKEDKQLEKTREQEDSHLEKQRAKEDTRLEKEREQEDSRVEKARDKEDWAVDKQQKKELEDTQYDDPDKVFETDEEQDAYVESQSKEWDRISAEHDLENRKRDDAREEEDNQLTKAREQHDEALRDNRDTDDETIRDRRDGEDELKSETRKQQDDDLEQRWEKEDEARTETRDSEDEALQQKRDRENELLEEQRTLEDEQDLTENYDPSQPRDRYGRWTNTGFGVAIDKASFKEISKGELGDLKHQQELVNSRHFEAKKLPEHIEEESDEFFNWLGDRDYPIKQGKRGIDQHIYLSGSLNIPLRRGETLDEFSKTRLEDMDTAMSLPGSKLPKDILLYRSLSQEQAELVRSGATEFTDKGFSSTATDYNAASNIGGDVIKVYAPKGTRAVFGSIHENEVILDRDSRFVKLDEGEWVVASTRTQVVNGLTTNDRWRFLTTPQKLEEFKSWLKQQVAITILAKANLQTEEDSWLSAYIEQAYRKGVERAFDDTRKPYLNDKLDFYRGTKVEFLRSSFGRPVSVERVNLLAARSYDDLKGVTEAMSTQISRELVDGMIKGESPREVARKINNRVDKIGKSRALTIARTETVAAHAQGQLDAFETLGVEELGVAVEWDTAKDGRVCERCRPLQGIVIKTSEAKGMIPRHPSCRCAWVPANVGEDMKGQLRTKQRITKAIDKSIRAEIPKKSKRSVGRNKRNTAAQQRKQSRWVGAGKKIAKARPKSILTNEQRESLKKLANQNWYALRTGVAR